MMKSRFQSICDQLEIPSEGYFELLDQAYSHPSRFYHNWDHIRAVLNRIDALSGLVEMSATRLLLVKFAAFYHDVVYIPGFSENESLSAELATAHLDRGHWSMTPAQWSVGDWIRSTRTHSTNDQYGQLLCDADLFGLSTTDYGINGLNVRREFGHIPESDWRIGRRSFLEKYLDKDKLFQLPSQEHAEREARKHMQSELRTLIDDASESGEIHSSDSSEG